MNSALLYSFMDGMQLKIELPMRSQGFDPAQRTTENMELHVRSAISQVKHELTRQKRVLTATEIEKLANAICGYYELQPEASKHLITDLTLSVAASKDAIAVVDDSVPFIQRKVLTLQSSAAGLPPGVYPIHLENGEDCVETGFADSITHISIEVLIRTNDLLVFDVVQIEVVGADVRNGAFDHSTKEQFLESDSEGLWYEDVVIGMMTPTMIPVLNNDNVVVGYANRDEMERDMDRLTT